MRYDDFRKRGLFVASGVLEAGCKTVVGQRFKRSGMHWTVRGTNAFIALRCLILSGGFEPFWEIASCRRSVVNKCVAHPFGVCDEC